MGDRPWGGKAFWQVSEKIIPVRYELLWACRSSVPGALVWGEEVCTGGERDPLEREGVGLFSGGGG